MYKSKKIIWDHKEHVRLILKLARAYKNYVNTPTIDNMEKLLSSFCFVIASWDKMRLKYWLEKEGAFANTYRATLKIEERVFGGATKFNKFLFLMGRFLEATL